MTETDAYAALRRHATDDPPASLRTLFDDDPDRAERLRFAAAGLVADMSKQRVAARTVTLLHELADERGVLDRLRATQAGAHVNTTEDRPALHTALRLPRDESLQVDGTDVVPLVHDELDRAVALAERVRGGDWTGATGQRIRTVVNVGIGGSDLGPRFLVDALRDHHDTDLELRFVSNVDPDDVHDAMQGIEPATTLVVVVSKSFGTVETLTNARTLRRWVVDALGEDAVRHHFIAVSTNDERVAEFGIDVDTMLGFWDWVGGRYSVSSVVGFSLLCAVGPASFRELLDGMRAMDQHAVDAPLEHNLPVHLALVQLWNQVAFDAQSQAVIPYSVRLAMLPKYLQQLEMESNGKRVTLDGQEVDHATGAVVWGQPGTDGQHAFFQLLHQGTQPVPVDLIGVLQPAHDVGDHHDQLLANLLAQGAALAFGRTSEEVAASGVDEELVPHRTFPGDRPTTTILLDELTPHSVGALVALYEQKVAALAALWGINAYDQWGVELGKVLATDLRDALVAEDPPDDPDRDTSTAALLARARAARGRAT